MYKALVTIVLLFLGISTFITLYFAKDSYSILPIAEENPDVSLEVYNFQEWLEFSSPEGEFTVLFPTLPQHATENLTDPKTNEVRNYDMYVAEKNDGTIFMISLISFPDNAIIHNKRELMEQMMNDMMASNPNNELRDKSFVEWKGRESLDYVFGNKEMTIDAKTFLVDKTLYVISRIARVENYNTNEFNFFVNSFELKKTNN